MVGDGDAEVTVGQWAEVLPVLDINGLVEPVQVTDLRHATGRRTLSEERVRRAARQRVHPEEDKDRDPEEDRDQKQDPADEIPKHLRPPDPNGAYWPPAKKTGEK